MGTQIFISTDRLSYKHIVHRIYDFYLEIQNCCSVNKESGKVERHSNRFDFEI